jgi:putative membrane protein
MMMGFGLIGLVAMIVFWGLLIVGAVFLVRGIFPSSSKRNESEGPSSLTAGKILDLRYARGEIDREEYEMMKGDLNS